MQEANVCELCSMTLANISSDCASLQKEKKKKHAAPQVFHKTTRPVHIWAYKHDYNYKFKQ